MVGQVIGTCAPGSGLCQIFRVVKKCLVCLGDHKHTIQCFSEGGGGRVNEHLRLSTL